jgi:predicted DNA-binding protein with PD1-like motif
VRSGQRKRSRDHGASDGDWRFRKCHVGLFEPAERQCRKIAIDEQVELLSLVGNIARDDQGQPRLHAQVVVGKSDGTAHGGHLLRASVRPTMEIVMDLSGPRSE